MTLAQRALVLCSAIILAACSSNGTPGPAGAEGPTGPAGANGLQGEPGAAGVAGATGGTGATGPTGPQGIEGATGGQGLQGPPGTVLVLDGGVVTGPPGSSVVVTPISPGSTCAAGGFRVTQLSDGGISNVCNGVGGATGATGSSGAIGATGAAGISGATGSTGAPGDAGPQGAAGQPGAQGPQGPAGSVLYIDGGSVFSASPVQFAGFTSTLYDGDLASATGANAKCQAEFSGSYFCTIADFDQANTATFPPASPGAAWIDEARAPNGVRNANSCNGTGGWTTNSATTTGSNLNDAGTVYFSIACNVRLPLACCRGGSSNVIFRGYTSASYNGDLNSATGANGKCQSQYPGSFFCTQADFDQANTASAPAVAAWIDEPRSDAGQRSGNSCNATGGWTTNSSTTTGSDLNDAGTVYFSANCSSTLPLACCQNQ